MSLARETLARLPVCATTGIGSLPFGDPAEAVAHVWGSYDLPFCPHLPALESGIGARPSRGGSDVCGWSPDRERQRPLCWPEVLRAVEAVPPTHGVVKIQVAGPCTTAWNLASRSRRRGLAGLACELGALFAANTVSCVDDLRARGAEALLVVDEPGLHLTQGTPIDHVAAWEPLTGVAGAWGLHVCCDPPWSLLSDARPDALFVDLRRHELGLDGCETVGQLVAHGGRLGLGVVPVSGKYHPDAAGAYAAARAIVSLVETGLDPYRIAAATLVTPTCGTAGTSPALERRLAASSSRIAEALADRARGAVAVRGARRAGADR